MWKKPNFFNISQANSLGEIWKNIPIFQKYVYQAKKKYLFSYVSNYYNYYECEMNKPILNTLFSL